MNHYNAKSGWHVEVFENVVRFPSNQITGAFQVEGDSAYLIDRTGLILVGPMLSNTAILHQTDPAIPTKGVT